MMVEGILGKKIGMTRIYSDGLEIPVTVIDASSCFVTQKKTTEKDGYEAIQLGFNVKKEQRVNKPQKGHFKKAGENCFYNVKEFKVTEIDSIEAGSEIKCADIFKAGDFVDISGKGKGKGFAGVMKRHGHSGGRASHGSHFHRAPGAIGQCADPSKVFKGIKMPGQMGDKFVTTQNVQVVEVKEEGLILLKGSVPGARGSVIEIRKALKK